MTTTDPTKSEDTMNITCIGVGAMGGAVARHLASGHFAVTAFDPSSDAVERCVAAGAVAAGSLAAGVASADLVLTSLPTPDLVVSTVDEVLEACSGPTVVMDISTIDPQTAREWMGEKTYRFASVEAATTFKLVSNLVGMTNVAVLAEGLAIAARAGIDPGDFAAALADTGAASFQSELRLPWMIDRDWASRFGVDLAAKDVRLAVASAAVWKIPTPVGSAALGQLMASALQGWGGEDVVAIAKLVDAGLRADVTRDLR